MFKPDLTVRTKNKTLKIVFNKTNESNPPL